MQFIGILSRGLAMRIPLKQVNWLQIMRITTSFLTGFFLSMQLLVASPGKGQESNTKKISIELNNVTFADAVRQIQKKGNVAIMYELTERIKQERITLTVKERTIPEILDLLVKNKKLKWDLKKNVYRIVDASEVPATPTGSLSSLAQSLVSEVPPNITGIIRDADGSPLTGVNVVVKGTKKGTVSSANGSFSIQANAGEVLVVSSIGYATKEIPVTNETSLFNITLLISESKLDVVQIQAYGSTSRRLSVANISSVKADDIAKSPVHNPLLAIQGRVPGILIEQSNGYAGSSLKVQIQGRNSIDRGNDPLYVIDGIPYFSELPSFNGLLNGGSRALAFIDPATIESIEILKDAAATSIYGSRAANGAILITTKKGKAGDTKVELNLQQGFGKVARRIELMNTEQYLAMRREAYMNDGLPVPDKNTTPAADNLDLTVYDQNRNTDWQKVLIGNTAQFTSINGSVSGGTSNMQFFFGGTYKRQTAVIPGNFADQNGTVQFNINSLSSNQRFRATLSGSYQLDNNAIIQRDLTQSAMYIVPNAPALYTESGQLNWPTYTSGNMELSAFWNPLSYLNTQYSVKTNNLISNLSLSYQLMKGLELKTIFAYSRVSAEEKEFNFLESTIPDRRDDYTRGSLYQNSSTSTYSISPQLTYKRNIGNGSFDFLLGADMQHNRSLGHSFGGVGYTTDLLVGDVSAAVLKHANTASTGEYRYNAVFGIARYNLSNKYLLEINARRDGSSRFGPENRFQNFMSVAGGWIFSNEHFIINNAGWLSFGKVRASYGTSGNDGIGDYAYQSVYGVRGGLAVPYMGIISIYPERLSNPYLQWEETRNLNLGMDLGFMKDRILFTLNYFRKRSGNQLLGYDLPATTGFGDISQNMPALVQNTGVEITLNTTNVQTKTFNWSSSFNLTVARNKLVEFPDLENSSYYGRLVLGKSLDLHRYYPFLGMDPATGNFLFQKRDKTVTSDNIRYPDDYTELIVRNPEFYGGFSNSISYKGFKLELLLSFSKQVIIGDNINNSALSPGSFADWGLTGNKPASQLDRWQKPGDQAFTGKYSTRLFINNRRMLEESSAFVEDGSYISFKNASFSWDLPAKWVGNAGLKHATLFMHGQNLMTITSFSGLDPETKRSVALPPLRIITFGAKLIF